MINLNEDPTDIEALFQDDVVMLDGQEFIVNITPIIGDDGIYLTKNTEEVKWYLRLSDQEKDKLEYSKYNIHVRDNAGMAVVTREEMIENLKTKQYTIE